MNKSDKDFITTDSDKQSRIAEAKSYFDLLFGNVTGERWSYLWTKQDKRTIPYRVSDSNERGKMASDAINFNDNGFDIYVGINCVDVKLPANRRAKTDEVTILTTTPTDIDILGGNHVDKGDKKYAPDFATAKSFLPFELSFLVDTGYGAHGYCMYREPVTVTDENRADVKKRNEQFIELVRSRAGIYKNTIDGVGDLPRILRVPGTRNYKLGISEAAPICHIVEVNDVRFSPAELDEKIAALMPKHDELFNPQTDKKSARTSGEKSESKTLHREDDEGYKIFRVGKMLDAIPVSVTSFDDWLHVGIALKCEGFNVDDWREWSRNDTRFKDGECEKRWETFKREELTIATIHEIAQRHGYREADIWQEYHGTNKNYRPAQITQTFDNEKLFDGWKPIPINAGVILNLADDEDKPALTSLFVDAKFQDFVAEFSIFDDSNAVDDTPFGDSGITVGEVKFALKRFAVKMFRYFKTADEVKNFVTERLSAAGAIGATKLIDDAQFWENATSVADELYHGKTFDAGYRFKRKIIDCANHSKGYRRSLERFDGKRLSDFLWQTEFTDVTCAELLIDIQGEFLRFDREQATWYTWTGNHWHAVQVKSFAPLYSAWTPLARKIRVFAEYESFRRWCLRDDYSAKLPADLNKRKNAADAKLKRLAESAKAMTEKIAKANALEQSRKIGNVFEQASGLPEIQIVTADLDRDKYLFNASNVTVNLQTMETYKARQSDLITMSTDTIFDADAVSEDWDNFLRDAIPDDNLRDWLQRFFGYCLSGITSEHIFLFIFGIGGSGKTTFLNAIGGALGDYSRIFSVDAICTNKKLRDGEEASPALADLRACRLARSSETQKNRRLDEAVVKRWTGSDKLKARELHRPPFEFFPSFKLVVDGNFSLRVTDINDDGLRRRLRIAPFNNPPPADKVDTMLSDKLSTPQAKSAILNWLLEGWRQYRARGLNDTPAVMQTALDDYYTANDMMGDFLKTCNYETGEKTNTKYRVAVKDAWRYYQQWQRQTPTASMLTRADFVASFLKATGKDGVELQDIQHKDFLVGCRIDAPESDDFIPPPFD